MSQVKAKAIYAFDGDTTAGELSIREGEVVGIVRQDVGEGWWEVIGANGKRGLAPGAYLEVIANVPATAPPSSRPRPPPPPGPPTTSIQNRKPSVTSPSDDASSAGVTMRNAGAKASVTNSTVFSAPPEAVRSSSMAPGRNALQPSQSNDDSFEDDSFDEEDSDYDRLNTDDRQRGSAATDNGSTLTRQTTDRGSTLSGVTEIAKSGALRRGLCRTFVKLGGEAFLLGQFSAIKVSDSEHIMLCESARGIFVWRSPAQSFTVTITAPRKTTKMRGLKTYTAYQLISSSSGLQVSRRYKQFDWLMSRLREKFVFVCVPPLPDKQITGLYEEEFIKSRMRKLQLWMNRVTRHPLLLQSEILQHFVSCTDDKRWKAGKRKAEKDELQGGRLFNAIDLSGLPGCNVTIVGGKPSFDTAAAEAEMDAFDEQVRSLDAACKQLSSVLHTSAKQQKSTAERVAKPFSDAITQLSRAGFEMNGSVTRIVPGTDRLQAALNKTSSTYAEIAKMYNEQASKDVEPFMDSLSEYHGLLSQLPELTLLHRNTMTAVHECAYQHTDEQKVNEEDLNKVCQRAMVIKTAVEAEANFFNIEKVKDFKEMMRSYLQQQVAFHREIASKLEAALKEFS